MLIEDVLIPIIYMVCPATPMILLINRMSRALIPEGENDELHHHLRTSMEFFRHDREAWKAVVKNVYASLPDNKYPTFDAEQPLPFKNRLSCWARWRAMVGVTTERSLPMPLETPPVYLSPKIDPHSRIFYDNLAYRTFEHCILTGKTHLMGGTSSPDISEAAGNRAWWVSFMDNEWTWAWPTGNETYIDEDVMCITMVGMPPIYFVYHVLNGSHSLYVLGELIGMARNIKLQGLDGEDETRGFGLLPESEVGFSFLNDSNATLELHRRLLNEYTSTETRPYLSLMTYKRRFIELELSRIDSKLMSVLLVNRKFVNYANTAEELFNSIVKVEHMADLDTRKMLKMAGRYRYYNAL